MPVQHPARDDRRAQAWTLDALLMTGFMVAGVVLATQIIVDVDDHRSGTDRTEAQLAQDAADLLAVAGATGALHNATLYWDPATGHWADAAGAGPYTTLPVGHPLAESVRAVVGGRGIAYSIDLSYPDTNGRPTVRHLVSQGRPGDHAVVATATVVLHDDNTLSNQINTKTIAEIPDFYAPDIFPMSSKYTVITVRLVIWRY